MFNKKNPWDTKKKKKPNNQKDNDNSYLPTILDSDYNSSSFNSDCFSDSGGSCSSD